MSSVQPAAALQPTPHHPSVGIDWTEFRLGWRILLLATFGIGINANASMLYAFGSMVLPLEKAFGWNRGDMQTAISFLFAGAVLGSQLVGWLNLRYGMRRVTIVSVICLSLVFAAMPLMGSSIGWLYLFFTLLPIASMGTMQVTWTHLVNLWFERNRGLSLALVLSGSANDALLDSYSAERQPVGRQVVNRAMKSHVEIEPWSEAAGLKPGMTEGDARANLAELFGDVGHQVRCHRFADCVRQEPNVADKIALGHHPRRPRPAAAIRLAERRQGIPGQLRR